jgi:hypothetical protein
LSEWFLRYLADTLWLDRFTTTLTVRLILYNPILNVMSHLKVTFNINHPVGVQSKKNLDSFNMYRSTRSIDVFVLLLEVAYCAYTLYFMVHVFKCISHERRQYFKNVWCFLDLIVVLMSLYIIVIYTCHAYFADHAVMKFQQTGDVIEFDTVLMLHHYVKYGLAALVTCAVLKFIHMLRFNPIVYRFLEILSRAKFNIIWSMFMLFLLILMFGSLFHIVGAGQIDMFQSVHSSMTELFISMLGKYEVDYLQEIHPFFAPLGFLVFLIISVYIFLSMTISILMETLRVVQKEELPDDEAYLLGLLIDRILQWLGIMRREGSRVKMLHLKRRKGDKELILRENTYV